MTKFFLVHFLLVFFLCVRLFPLLLPPISPYLLGAASLSGVFFVFPPPSPPPQPPHLSARAPFHDELSVVSFFLFSLPPGISLETFLFPQCQRPTSLPIFVSLSEASLTSELSHFH